MINLMGKEATVANRFTVRGAAWCLLVLGFALASGAGVQAFSERRVRVRVGVRVRTGGAVLILILVFLSSETADLVRSAGPMMFRTRSPLTRDFVRLGRVPHWGDTRRARLELIPELEHPTFETGVATLWP